MRAVNAIVAVTLSIALLVSAFAQNYSWRGFFQPNNHQPPCKIPAFDALWVFSLCRAVAVFVLHVVVCIMVFCAEGGAMFVEE